jgi:hypothetical protein
MSKSALLMAFCLFMVVPINGADLSTIDLDLAKKSDTITVKPETDLTVRLTHTLLKKDYRRPDGSKIVRITEVTGTGEDAACKEKSIAKVINGATTEAEIAKGVDDAVKSCTDEQKTALLKFATEQTAVALGTFRVDFGKSVTITIVDPAAPWTFTLVAEKTTVVVFDLSRPSGATVVSPGGIKTQLKNAIVGKKYRHGPAGEVKQVPVPLKGKPDDCVAKVTEELAKIDNEKDAEIKPSIPPCVDATLVALVKEKGAEWQTIDLESDTINAGETRIYRIERLASDNKVDKNWTFTVTGAGEKVLTSADHPKLDEQRALTEKSPSLTTVMCSYTAEFCKGDAIYVNADQISTVYITELPPEGGTMQVRVTAGESFHQDTDLGCSALNFNYRNFSSAPDRIVIPITTKAGYFGIGSVRWSTLIAEAERQYKVRCGKKGEIAFDDRNTSKPPDDPSIPLVVRGKSSLLTIQIVHRDRVKTISVPIRYQRFWMDAGGFFVFAKVKDQFLVKETLTDDATQTRILARKNNQSIRPATGIVVNVHPGNFPLYAFQFGLATAENRLPSYYLGLALRARELGRRSLASIGFGVALQQEDHFPYVKENDIRKLDDPALTVTRRYGFQPYVSLAFGFSFGGVSEKTDVAASVTTTH